MKERDVITLEDNSNYLILDEIEYEGRTYYLGVRALEDDLDYKDFKFFEYGVDEAGPYADEVLDDNLFKSLYTIELASESCELFPHFEKAFLKEDSK